MAAMPNSTNVTSRDLGVLEELRQARREIELLKTMDPFRAAEMAIEIQVERMRVSEAIGARDAAVSRLASAYTTIRNGSSSAETSMRTQVNEIEFPKLVATIHKEENANSQNRTITPALGGSDGKSARNTHQSFSADPPPLYTEAKDASKENEFSTTFHTSQLRTEACRVPYRILREEPLAPLRSIQNLPIGSRTTSFEGKPPTTISEVNIAADNAARSDDPEVIAKSRDAVLSALPLPFEVPEDALQPIETRLALHDFLGSVPSSMRNSLSNYRVFQHVTTSWCTEREEHGYFLTPVFKCHTNPRVATAHRWSSVDVIGKLKQPTECFYNKDGQWYYAGVYKAFRLDDLTTKEWEALSNEAAQAVVRETISGRKNTSPQNIYEVTQLYLAGALKVAVVALQCVGFNNAMYRTILAHAAGEKLKADTVLGGEAGQIRNCTPVDHLAKGLSGISIS